MVVAATEQTELFVAMSNDVVRLVANKDVDDVLRLEALFDGADDLEHKQQFVGSLHSCTRM